MASERTSRRASVRAPAQAPEPQERQGLDDAFVRTALEAGERWHSRVSMLPLLLGALFGSGAIAVLAAHVEPVRRNLPQPTVLLSVAIVAAALTAVLLWLRTDVLDDERVGWAAPGYVAAALLMLLAVEQVPDIYAQLSDAAASPEAMGRGMPEGATRTLDRAFSLHLTWHLAFAGAALGGLALERRTAIRRTFLGGVVLFGLLRASDNAPAAFATIDLTRFDGVTIPYSGAYWAASWVVLGMLLVAALAWLRTLGARPPVARAWVAITIVLVALGLAFHMAAGLGGFTWITAATVMQVLAFAVGLGGQVLGLRATVDGQLAFERDVAARYAAGTMADAPGPDQPTDRDLISAEDVRRVLRTGRGLAIHVQPIVAMADGRVAGFEALSRFGPTAAGDLHSPDRWFAAAEAHGLGQALELTAVRLALDVLDDLPPDTYLSVNVGPETLVGETLLALLGRVDATRVKVELTEHAPVEDYVEVTVALDRLRALGCGIAVDDAGAGFSSLRHITRLAPDVLKVDVSLVRDIDRLPLSRAMVSALVAYANRVGARLIAEGVETPAEAATLASLGVELGQGWHWGRAQEPVQAPARVALSSRP